MLVIELIQLRSSTILLFALVVLPARLVRHDDRPRPGLTVSLTFMNLFKFKCLSQKVQHVRLLYRRPKQRWNFFNRQKKKEKKKEKYFETKKKRPQRGTSPSPLDTAPKNCFFETLCKESNEIEANKKSDFEHPTNLESGHRVK